MMIKRMVSLFLACVLACGLSVPGFAESKSKSKSLGKDMLEIVNDSRERVGSEPVRLNADLMAAAQVRAKEISTNYAAYGAKHARPDGSAFYSVASLVWGENAASGQRSEKEAMKSWINSPAHRANLQDPKYTIMGVGRVEKGGTIYWIQLFGTGESNERWSGIDWGSIGDGEPNEAIKAAALVDEDGKVIASAAANQMKSALKYNKGSSVYIRVKNAKSIAPKVFEKVAAAAQGSGKTALIYADTMDSSGKNIRGRLILEAAKLADRSKDLRTAVYVGGSNVAESKSAMEKMHPKVKAALVSTAHKGGFGATVKVVAKVNLDGMDPASLAVYRYDSENKDLVLLENADCSVDSGGFVTFRTVNGGDFVIADRKL